MGKLIVLDGLDGSGKQTQADLLWTHFEQHAISAKRLSFPTYTKSSALIEMYLGGSLGSLAEVNVYAASTFYAVDRYASFVQEWGANYHNGGVVLADRYVTSNIIHQMGKLDPDEWQTYMTWLEDLEYLRFGLPKPTVVLYLDIPVALAVELLLRRSADRGLQPDLHESNFQYLHQCRQTALFAAEHCGWTTINCAPHGVLRSVEDISGELIATVHGYLGDEPS